MDERTQKYRIKSLSNEGDDEPQISHHNIVVSFPYNAQHILCGFEVTLYLFICCFLGESLFPGKRNKTHLFVGDENEKLWKISFLATIKTINKGFKCSSDNENMVWLVGFIIKEEISYPLF